MLIDIYNFDNFIINNVFEIILQPIFDESDTMIGGLFCKATLSNHNNLTENIIKSKYVKHKKNNEKSFINTC